MLIAYSPEPDSAYASPWMYKVCGWLLAEGKAEFETLELSRPGQNTVCCDVPAGTILSWGRRNYKRGKSTFHFGVVLADGDLLPLSAEQLRKYFHGL